MLFRSLEFSVWQRWHQPTLLLHNGPLSPFTPWSPTTASGLEALKWTSAPLSTLQLQHSLVLRSWCGTLTKSNATEENMSRIPLILTYHPSNNRIQRILLDDFKVFADDPATKHICPQPAMVAFWRDGNFKASPVSSHSRKASCNTRRHLSLSTTTLQYLWPYFQRNPSSRTKRSLNHQRVIQMFVLWSNLLHLLPSLPCFLHRRDWAHSKGT